MNDLIQSQKISKNKFSVVISIGPGEHEVLRLHDLIHYLIYFDQENLEKIVVIDDSRKKNSYESILHKCGKVIIFESPRQGKGDNWRGGLATNILFGIKKALQLDNVKFVLKLDTDSFIIGSSYSRLATFFKKNPKVGVVGSNYQFDLYGNEVAPSTWSINLHKHSKLVRPRRNPFLRIEFALWGRKKYRRKLLLKAINNNWALGACAQGGGYAVSADLVQEWINLQFINDNLLWLDTDLGEDVIVALLCFAANYMIMDFNGENGVFGVQYKGLGLPLDEFFRRKNSVIHSTKKKTWEEETDLRNQIKTKINSNKLFLK
jgi:hypothetical protein